MATKSKQTLGQQMLAAGDVTQEQANAIDAHEAPSSPGKAAETQDVARGGSHRLAVPTAPAAKTDADVAALRLLRAALEKAGYRNHPQALDAALQDAEAVPVLRAGRQVQAYRAEALDYLRGRIQQRDARAAS